MLDIKRIRENFNEVKEALEKRGKGNYDLGKVLEIDEKRRDVLRQFEEMRARQNVVSKEIPRYKKEGKDATEILVEMKELSAAIKLKETEVNELDEMQKELVMSIPNTPSDKTPIGKDDTDNVEIRKYSEPRNFEKEGFTPLPHWEIGERLGILDFERAAKISGARFALYKGKGARLERAIINFMLNLHTDEHKYTEILPPFLVNRAAMTGTGQLPKFEDDMFHIPDKDLFLVPTAEVPVTNLYDNEILSVYDLPICHTAYTPCFRKEAGSAGRDTRGLIRLHQFNKVELVKFTTPENSFDELESLTAAAEEVLKRLAIPYRVVAISTGDIGFSSAFTYDIEVWMPSYGRYVEISSCSNYLDFQARRGNIKFRRDAKAKPEFVHTLNGSGLAVGRTVAAILENYQNADGSISIPDVLIPYMGSEEISKC